VTTVKSDAEVLILGGGVAGSTLSRLLAEKGYEVLLAECLPKEKIGQKVCGNAVPEKYFDRAGIPKPEKGEFESQVSGLRIHSPDLKTVFTIHDKGYVLNRHRFGQRLINQSLDSGARLIDRTLAISPLVENNRVLGAHVKNMGRHEEVDLFGKITVDATGSVSKLRSLLPSHWWVSEHVGRGEGYSLYREIRVLRDEIEDSKYCHVFLSNQIAPFGYYWIFPQGPMRVNIGVGVYSSLRKNPKEIFYSYLAGLPELKGSKIVDHGGGTVPNRRPLGSAVWNGFACIGDAGYQVNPLAGEGIGPSIDAAKILSEVLLGSTSEEYTLELLWPFNCRYMELCGARFSALYAFFWLMGGFSDEEMSYTMASGLISEDDLESFKGSTQAGWTRMTNLLLLLPALFSRLSLLRKLKSLGDMIKEVFDLYSSYPSDPLGFERWRKLDLDFNRKLKSLYQSSR
jgi:geranylgeranyl reductase family protein